jgi:hypothetical protein
MTKANRDGILGDENFENHESYGLISFSRVQGSTHLFGSPVVPLNYIKLSISEGRRHHGLGWSNYFDGKVETVVHMSETQFAEFITTPNRGCGVPCTFRYRRDGKLRKCDGPPVQETEASVTQRHFKEDMQATMAAVETMQDEIDAILQGGKVPKKHQDAVRKVVWEITRTFNDSAPFTMEQFEKNVEKTIATARVEISAHARLTAEVHGQRDLANTAAIMLGETPTNEELLAIYPRCAICETVYPEPRLGKPFCASCRPDTYETNPLAPDSRTLYSKCVLCVSEFAAPHPHPICVACDSDLAEAEE